MTISSPQVLEAQQAALHATGTRQAVFSVQCVQEVMDVTNRALDITQKSLTKTSAENIASSDLAESVGLLIEKVNITFETLRFDEGHSSDAVAKAIPAPERSRKAISLMAQREQLKEDTVELLTQGIALFQNDGEFQSGARSLLGELGAPALATIARPSVQPETGPV